MGPKKKSHHFLILFLPFQSHINPSLQLAKNLARYGGAKVTLATTHGGLKKMKSLPSLNGLSYAAFTDENDDDYQSNNGFSTFVDILKIVGPKNLFNLMQRFSDEGRPVTVLVYSILLSWVAEVAREFHLPSAFHCIQSATVFTIYHHFFNSRDGIHGKMDNMDCSIKPVPELPLFSSGDLPTFLLPGNPSSDFLIPWMKQHIRVLEEVPKSSVLVNTFQELEQESIKVVDTVDLQK